MPDKPMPHKPMPDKCSWWNPWAGIVVQIARPDADLCPDPGLDWASFDFASLEACAERMGLFPLFAWRALECSGDAIPVEVRRRWIGRQRELAALMLVLASENGRLLDRFQSAGIDVLPVKGPTLAETIYGNPLLRDFQDLDYVVLYEEMPAACRILEEGGYAPETCGPGSSAFGAAQKLMDHHTREIRYRRASGAPALVELHWDVFPGIQPTPRPSQWSAEIYALYLAMHGGRHLWQPLKHLCDLRDWLAYYAAPGDGYGAFDWTAFFDLARRQRLQRVATAGVALIRQIWGPEAVTGAPAVTPPGGSLLRYVLAQREAAEDLWTHHRLRMALLDTAAKRAAYALRLLGPTWTELDLDRPDDFWSTRLKRGARLAKIAWRRIVPRRDR